jgi:hypothetical protein
VGYMTNKYGVLVSFYRKLVFSVNPKANPFGFGANFLKKTYKTYIRDHYVYTHPKYEIYDQEKESFS